MFDTFIFWPQTITNEELWRTTKFEEMVVYIRKKKLIGSASIYENVETIKMDHI